MKSEDAGLAAVESEVALIANKKIKDYKGTDIWIGDTGATSHMLHELKEVCNVKESESNIQIGNGNENYSSGKVQRYYCSGRWI